MNTNQKIKTYRKLTLVLTITTIIPTALLLMSLSSFKTPANGSTQVSSAKARSLILNFRNSPTGSNSPVNGVLIEESQLESMKSISSENPNTKSYRMYFAEDSVGTSLSVVVGVDGDGKDMTESIYSTSRKGTNLCPTMCDAASTIGN